MEDFGKSCEKFLREVFTFSGRLSRKKYAQLGAKIFCIGVVFLTFKFIVKTFLEYNPEYLLLSSAFDALNIMVAIILWIWIFGIVVRRLHDRDRSGWKILIPITIGIFTDFLIVWMIFSFVLGSLEGTDGANKYGDKPPDDED